MVCIKLAKTQLGIVMNKALISLFALSLVGAFAVTAEEKIGKVVITKNAVHATFDNEQRVLKRRSTILTDDVVTTGAEARAQFRLNDGTLFTLGEKSEMTMTDYQFGDNRRPKAEFELVKGVFRSITGKITQVNNPDFVINTPMGSIGIRGTDFWGGYLDEDKIDVILLSGEHPIIIENEFGRVEITEQGTGVTIERNKAPTQPYPWSDEKLARAVETITID